MIAQVLGRLLVGGRQQSLRLAVDGELGLFRERPILLWVGVQRRRRNAVAGVAGHAKVHDHASRQAGGLLQVRRASGRDVILPEDELLGSLAAHKHLQACLQLEKPLGILLTVGDGPRDAQGVPTRHDGRLVHWVGARVAHGDQRVPTLMVGGELLLLLAHGVLPLQADDDPVEGLLEGPHWHARQVLRGGPHRCEVEDIEQVRSCHPGCALRQRHELDVLVKHQLRSVQLQDVHAPLEVGHWHDHLLVQPSGPGQRLVQRLREVGGADDYHPVVGLKPVQLDEQLVQTHPVRGLVHTIPLRANGINLVDEDDARRMLPGLLEEVSDAAGPHANKHLLELGARDLEEGHASLAGDGPREERLAGARWAGHQHALRQLRTQAREAVRILKVQDDFLQLVLHLINALHVVERGGDILHRHRLPGAAAELLRHAADHALGEDRDACY
mmetsp:Transcript_73819/g.190511  ORF Transcript_73819/g.190511 Transcript_73819/m.190511 type:complete len:444 (-) Transcript_73819:732-2063(-)